MKKKILCILILFISSLALFSCNSSKSNRQTVVNLLEYTFNEFDSISYSAKKTVSYNQMPNVRTLQVDALDMKTNPKAIIQTTTIAVDNNTTNDSFYVFNNKTYNQTDGVKNKTFEETLLDLSFNKSGLKPESLNNKDVSITREKSGTITKYILNIDDILLNNISVDFYNLPFTIGNLELIMEVETGKNYFSTLYYSIRSYHETTALKFEMEFEILKYNTLENVDIPSEILELLSI